MNLMKCRALVRRLAGHSFSGDKNFRDIECVECCGTTSLRLFSLITCVLGFYSAGLKADDAPAFRPLFNSQNLDGWVAVNTAPSTWSVKDGMLICSGKPIGELRTARMYQNFVLELEWRHLVPKGNAGVFVWADDITALGVPFHRGVEVQVLENAYGNGRGHTTHGDIFPIHGARMTPVNGRGGSRAFPTENRSRPSPAWNHYRITCNDGDITLAVNGKIVTRGKNSSPRKGYICLESEGGVVHYRNIMIRELPATEIRPEEVAIGDRGYRSVYNGVDLAGWQSDSLPKSLWEVNDWVLSWTGKVGSVQLPLKTTATAFRDVGFIVDVRRKPDSRGLRIDIGGTTALSVDSFELAPNILRDPGKWNRIEGALESGRLTISINGQKVAADQIVDQPARGGPLELRPIGPIDFANLYVREIPIK